jgi:hypothetical protein
MMIGFGEGFGFGVFGRIGFFIQREEMMRLVKLIRILRWEWREIYFAVFREPNCMVRFIFYGRFC